MEVCSSTEMGAPGASHLGTGDHGPKTKTDRSRPRSVPLNAAGSANSTLTVCRHVGLWPGGCPEPALRATDISWLPNVEKYRSQPSRIATPAHRCRSHCGHPGRSVRPDVISLARGRALRKGHRFGVIRDPLELVTPRPRVSSQSFKPGQD